MVRSKRKIAVVVLAVAVALAGSAGVVPQTRAQQPQPPDAAGQKSPAGKTPHASQLDLTPATCAKLRAAIGPQGSEWRHLRIHWYTDLVAARKKAAAQDRPILVFRTGGAGYNDPLGQC